jgi:hypothetical protein
MHNVSSSKYIVMPSTTSKTSKKKKEVKRDIAATYDEFKEFEGQQYTGMKVGRSHKWHYDKGIWKETKMTPDLWQIDYAVIKRRAGKAPEGSGVPVGTQYHWYILAHQNVTKLDANNYTTALTGLKFKIAHKRADKDTWSVTAKTQRKRMIKFLQDIIKELEKDPEEVKKEAAKKPVRKTRVKKKAGRRKAEELAEA